MNFNNLDGEKNEIWENYFDELNMIIPQDSLGINPAAMSKSKNINTYAMEISTKRTMLLY